MSGIEKAKDEDEGNKRSATKQEMLECLSKMNLNKVTMQQYKEVYEEDYHSAGNKNEFFSDDAENNDPNHMVLHS
jgi:hypothetical protein